MKKKLTYLMVLAGLCLACSTVQAETTTTTSTTSSSSETQEAHWGYEDEISPEYWGSLSEEYAACSDGTEQSPINITGAEDVDLPSLSLKSKSSKVTVLNNGHTIQVTPENSDNTLTVGDKTYTLKQFHFHAPSENEIDGKQYPLEGHFVYKTDDGQIAVVSVLYQYGKENKGLKEVWKNMPTKVNEEKEVSKSISISNLFPEDQDYYNFEGSLTTPPCTEGVNWIVFKKQETISKAQVKKFSETIGVANNRPLQDLNGREIEE
ncbi:carbonic anhydrase [Streptococcus loxodontisalivarius]|uniref:Carbonic anhydrase n=1 Tax=Streptococcus loxodontisalivarius TaxID=1349415 RepID=A0ABS2PWY6_9STRE|nr:carbonic anhydrase family protein [Streptococcus loxodontisalivarius]MBM7643807.1 carbonic anhydrase [Streptococcus loxodontisalivarius]